MTDDAEKNKKPTQSKKNRGLGRGLTALMNDLSLTEQDAQVSDGQSNRTSADLEAPIKTSDQVEPSKAPFSSKDMERLAEIEALEQQLLDTHTPQAGDDSGTTMLSDAPAETRDISSVAINRLVRNPNQPRKIFERGQMDELIRSIQQRGVLQPVLVRPLETKSEDKAVSYQIVAGERRWQAALKAGLTAIPIIIRDLSDRDVLEIGVIENVQRADLNPLEEAMAYEQLITEFGRTQAEIAENIGKSRSHVANTIRLLGLSQRGRDLLLTGEISAGHARAVLAADEPDALVEAIIEQGLSVREAESWVKGDEKAAKPTAGSKATKTADIEALEKEIRDKTGVNIDIRHKGKGGELRLRYRDLKEMDRLLGLIRGA